MVSERRTRRAILGSTAATLASLAGCAGLGDESNPSTTSRTTSRTTTRTTTRTTERTTTETTEQTTTETTSEEEPGYIDYHWHGQLFFDIDGELVDFDRPKYYLDNIEQQRPETVYFHFHDSAHGPNEWSNEKEVVTFARGLNLLPGISYSKRGGDHVVEYEGTTYHGGQSGTEVSIHEGTENIDPTRHEVAHDDQYWVSVSTGDSSNGGASRSGKMMFDVNNRRLDFSASKYRRAGTKRFQFQDSDPPYFRWTSDGDPITLAEVFEQLPDITYRNDDGHVVRYAGGGDHDGTYRERDRGTNIVVRQRATPVDPTSYELQDGDVIWVYVHAPDKAPENEH
ncbi:hypothetical protein [Halomicrococcus sp. SG-WS-1]|uniref:hypothetical protein n=1 Tax=Halomicrococcus sp. SG-WS-1 TaxID=3439057 RepID=UPI003F78F5A4